ncbi:MAG: hypothetical protein HXS47_04985 [Theionarchaea archaeon]|nr:hypothetical protein [Theionarchaea archaeon]
MDAIDLSDLVEDEDTLLKITALTYMGVGVYLAMRKKPLTAGVKTLPEPQTKPEKRSPQTLSEMIRMMMEEAVKEPGS